MTVPKLLILASLSLAVRLPAENIVVFAKGESRILDSASIQKPNEPAKASFLDAAKRDFERGAPYDAAFPLINPPAWGRVVSGDTTGKLQIRRSFVGGFAFHLDLEHLLPKHTYVLCINGRPDHPGNELLPESVPGHDAEKYYDFCTVTTDPQGAYHAGFALLLHPGPYNVHFYVKDTTDFKIVLYGLEYFDFTVN